MTSKLDSKQVHMLPSILRSKGNEIMKFGQLIEYNMRKISRKIMHKM